MGIFEVDHNHFSGSHFIGLPMQTLHAHRRRVPTQDILRSVHVGVVAVPASDTFEGRLALATPRVNGTTSRTGLRRKGGVDFDNPAAALLHLVSEDPFKSAPTLVQDGAVETGFLPHHAP